MKRLPPQQVEKNLSDLIDLVPELCEDLLESVDQPLQIARDKTVGKDYLCNDYNRDGESYRSHWSNQYEPAFEDGTKPSERMRKMEIDANTAFGEFVKISFVAGVSSVYLWDLDHGFAGVILFKSVSNGDSKEIKSSCDSIHVVEVDEKRPGGFANYKLTSTIMLWLDTNEARSGHMHIGGEIRHQSEKDALVRDSSSHIANIGRLVEDAENKIQSQLDEIYFGKIKDYFNSLRSVQPLAEANKCI